MRQSDRRPTRITAVACLSALLAFPAVAEVFKGLPDVIVCSIDDPSRENGIIHMLFYLATQQVGSHTLYSTMGARVLELNVSNDGIVTESNKGSCQNKSVTQLEASGQAFYFGKP
jgi:hypothetical protein